MSTMTFGGRTFSNGNVPSAILAPLEPRRGHGSSRSVDAHMRRDAADAWNRARAEVLRTLGLDLRVRGWNRTLAEQQRFWNQRMTLTVLPGRPTVRWNGRTWYRRPGYAAVAPPGTSNHGWGLAVDIIDFGAVGQWNHPRRVRSMPILAKHGWTETEGRQRHVNEPWHLVYSPAADRGKSAPASTPTATAPNPDLEDWFDMAKYKRAHAALNQPLPRGAWTTVRLNKQGHVSLLTGPKNLWDAVSRLRFDGLAAGQEVRVRFIEVLYGGGKPTKVRATYPVIDIIGSKNGHTYGLVAMRGRLPGRTGGQSVRLRMQVRALTPGVTLVASDTRILHR